MKWVTYETTADLRDHFCDPAWVTFWNRGSSKRTFFWRLNLTFLIKENPLKFNTRDSGESHSKMFHGTKIFLPSVRFPSRPKYRILPSVTTLFTVFYRPFPLPYRLKKKIPHFLHFASKILQKTYCQKVMALNLTLGMLSTCNFGENLFKNWCFFVYTVKHGKMNLRIYFTVLYRPADGSSPYRTFRTVKYGKTDFP
jgi:hypothetical protein